MEVESILKGNKIMSNVKFETAPGQTIPDNSKHHKVAKITFKRKPYSIGTIKELKQNIIKSN